MSVDAYIAGLFDGEGCVGVRPRKDGYVNLDLNIGMTNEAVVRWVHEQMGVGAVYPKPPDPRGNRRASFHWKVGSAAGIAVVLDRLRPYLRVKRAEATVMAVVLHLRRAKSNRTGGNAHRPAEHLAASIARRLKADDVEGAFEEA